MTTFMYFINAMHGVNVENLENVNDFALADMFR